MSEVLRVDAEKLQAAVAAIMEKEGVAPQDAAIVADSLVSAELTGLQSHGVQRVKFYTDSMEAGGTDPRCRIKTIRDFTGGALLDAQGALGIVAAYRAMELAIQKAKDVGIGIVNVRNSNHCSCTAYYIRMAAKENMLAIVSSNAPKSMAPWGSREKYLGTNPLAVGAPTHGDPVMIDMATSVVARGKIMNARQQGKPIPEGWALDAQGKPTTDPEAAMKGTMIPVGDAKGAALAMMVEILTGCLNGANCGYEAAPFMADDHLPPDLGQTFMAIDPEKCSGSFLAKVGSLAGVISSQDGARIPGERRFQQRRRNLREGIFIPDDLFRELVDLARQGRQI